MFTLSEKLNYQSMVSVKSYSYTNLLLNYGPNKEVTFSLSWSSKSKGFRMVSLFVSFSSFLLKIFAFQIFVGGISAINAHSMMLEQLQSHLNRHYNLSHIVQVLHETYQPLSSIAKLPIIPQLGIPVNTKYLHFVKSYKFALREHSSFGGANKTTDSVNKFRCRTICFMKFSKTFIESFQRPQVPVLTFCILPQSPTLIRLSYQSMYCLEIRFRGGGLVSIRDGAYSRFDRSNVVEEFSPTQGLKVRQVLRRFEVRIFNQTFTGLFVKIR